MVSVVIPLFNKREYIQQAIRSVLAQSQSPAEVFVVDDGSRDGSADLVEQYSPPVTLIRCKNSGVSAARNLGIEAAKKEFIAFLDADDSWEPTFLESVASLLVHFPDACVAGTAYQWLVASGQVRRLRFPATIPKHPWQGTIDYFACVATTGAPPLNSSNVIVRAAAIRGVGGFPIGERWGEDHDTWARLALAGQVAFSTEVLCTVNVSAANRATERADERPPLPAIRTVVSALATVDDSERRRYLKKYLEKLVIGSAAINLRYGFRGEARRQLVWNRQHTGMSVRWIALVLLTALPARITDFIRGLRRQWLSILRRSDTAFEDGPESL